MGNQLPSVDFVTRLPPELLSVVLAFLPLNDVLRCLQVCKRWKETILNLQPYWTSMLTSRLNLSRYSIEKYSSLFSRRSDIFFDVKRRLIELQAVEFVCSSPVCYPAYPVSKCFVMPQQNIVVRTGENNHCGLYVERLLTRGDVIYTQTLYERELSRTCNVVWGHFSKNNCLYWVDSAIELGMCYDTVGDRVLHTFSFLNDVFIGDKSTTGIVKCCEECSLCVVWYMKSRTTTNGEHCKAEGKGEWNTTELDVEVLCLGDAQALPQVLPCDRTVCKCLQRDYAQPFGFSTTPCRSLQVISTRKCLHGHTGHSVCPDHCALLMDGSYYTLLSISTRKEKTATESAMQITTECLSCKYHFQAHGRIVLCGAFTGIGNIFHNCLEQWIEKGVVDLSCECSGGLVKTPGKSKVNFFSVICIGQQLSILRHFRTPETCTAILEEKFYIVHTENGRLYKTVQNQLPSPKHRASYGGSHYMDCIVTLEAQQWLNDIRNPCPAVLLTVLLGGGEGRLGFLSIQQGQEQLERHDCVYAVNNFRPDHPHLAPQY